MLDPDIPDDLSQLLAQWFRAEEHGARAGMGYPSECPSTRGYQARGWRDDVLDSDMRAAVVEGVGLAIGRLPRIQQCAAGILARNAATGRAVWRSAILPEGDAARREVFRATISALSLAMGLTRAAEAAYSRP